MERVQQPWLNNDFIFSLTKLSRRLYVVLSKTQVHLDKIAACNKKSSLENIQTNDSVIDLLMDEKNKFTEREIRDEALMFIIAVSI